MPPKIQRTIQVRINKIIDYIGETPKSLLFNEAENYICALCDMERKPCLIHSDAKCAMMIKTGTELELLRSTDKSIYNGDPITCLNCGEQIPSNILLKKPLEELCPQCYGKVEKILPKI